MSHTHLLQQEKYAIGVYRQQGQSIRWIAEEVGRSASMISRELRRNSQHSGCYDAERAQRDAEDRQRERSSRPWKLNGRMRAEIQRRLRCGEAPDIIAGRCRRDRVAMISGEWIYAVIYRDRTAGGDLWRYLPSTRERRKKRTRGGNERGQLVNRVMITERPAELDARVRLGDWEGDSLVGRGNRSRLVSMVER